MKNCESIQFNSDLNILNNKTLNKFLFQVTKEYINIENFTKNNEFILNLTSNLFDYLTIFNQDKMLFQVYKTNTKKNYIYASYNGTSLIMSYIKGLNMKEYKQVDLGSKTPMLDDQWADYNIVKIILDFYYQQFKISQLYIKDTGGDNDIHNKLNLDLNILSPLDKAMFIYDNLIYNKEILDEKKTLKDKENLYFVSDSKKNFPLIQIIPNQIF